MAKVKLGSPPKAFAPIPVNFTMPDGTEGTVTVTFKYRTRKEFGKFQNEMMLDQSAEESRTPEGRLDFEKLYENIGASNAKHLLSCVDSWDLEEPVEHDVLAQLADEIPASVVAMMQAYNKACTEGRLGN